MGDLLWQHPSVVLGLAAVGIMAVAGIIAFNQPKKRGKRIEAQEERIETERKTQLHFRSEK